MTGRTSHRKFTIALLAAAALTGPAGAGVIGEDGRRAPDAEDAALVNALGHIVCTRIVDDRRRRSAGTATVVGNRRTILTAAHIFTDAAGRRGPAVRFDPVSDCVFRQYDSEGNVTAEASFQFAEMGEYWRNAGVPDQDWAILKTAESLPNSTHALPFANGSDEPAGPRGLSIRILAYHADVRTAPCRPCARADMGRMSSGAAIVYRTLDGQDVVVGINRSSANLGTFNLAVPLSVELLDVLRSFAWGQVPIQHQRLASLETGRTDVIATP